MTERGPFIWQESPGWIVLSGAADPLGETRALALSRANAGGDIAYISLSDDMADALMDDMADLGAPTGYLVDLEAADNNAVYAGLIEADLIVIDAAASPDRLLRLMRQTAVHALKEALQRGALLLFEGESVAIAGEYFLMPDGNFESGLGYVSAALIKHDDGPKSDEASLRARLALPEVVLIGIAPGAALALGPGGQLETWGDSDITISLSDMLTPRTYDKA